MIRKILDVKNPKLRQISKPVDKIDKRIISIASDLKDTLAQQKDPEGVGLAAVQIGLNIRMFAMLHNSKIRIIINPEIVSFGKNKKRSKNSIMEGCLSILNYYGPLKRPQQLTLKYQNLEGKIKTEKLEGLSAQIVQHEVDHLNGILFTDKLIKQKASLYKFEKGDWEEVEF